MVTPFQHTWRALLSALVEGFFVEVEPGGSLRSLEGPSPPFAPPSPLSFEPEVEALFLIGAVRSCDICFPSWLVDMGTGLVVVVVVLEPVLPLFSPATAPPFCACSVLGELPPPALEDDALLLLLELPLLEAAGLGEPLPLPPSPPAAAPGFCLFLGLSC